MSVDESDRRLGFGRLILLVIVPFGTGYFINFIFRNVNAVLAPELTVTFGLGASELGLLTSAFFIVAAIQFVPLALILDRYGPRRVLVGQLLITTLACIVSSLAESFAMLLIGRALLGCGIAGCLTTALKAVTVWFPRDRYATANGLILFAGGLGALTATRPLQLILETVGWRDLFLVVGAICAVLAIAALFVVPEANAPRDPAARSSIEVYRAVLGNPVFLRVAPAAAMALAGFFSIQALWANGWMSDVAGLDQVAIGERLMLIAVAMTFGMALNGAIADTLARRGIGHASYLACAIAVLLVGEFVVAFGLAPGAYWPWLLIGFMGNVGALVHPILNPVFPSAYAARSISTIAASTFALVFIIQAGLGFVLDLWGADPAGHYPAVAYKWGLGTLVVTEILCLAWFVWSLPLVRAEVQRAATSR